MDNRRRHDRVKMSLNVLYGGLDGKEVLSSTMDISMSGMFVKTDAPLTLGTAIGASIDAGMIGKVVNVEGHVIREQEDGMAVEFVHVGEKDMGLLLTHR